MQQRNMHGRPSQDFWLHEQWHRLLGQAHMGLHWYVMLIPATRSPDHKTSKLNAATEDSRSQPCNRSSAKPEAKGNLSEDRDAEECKCDSENLGRLCRICLDCGKL